MRPREKRLPRAERHDGIVVAEDENQHLWAVSYSDFLMALLAFFILFFSMDDPPGRQKLIMQIAGEFKGDASSTGLKSPGFGAGNGYGDAQNKRMPSALMTSLKTMNVKVDQEKESLVINLPDDFFMPGQYKVSSAHNPKIQAILDLLKPYGGKINIYFEGHADSSPLRLHKNDIIVDNFVLSSLRASTMLQLALGQGFPEKNLFIQAASSNIRNSRSLSIRVEPTEEVL